MRTKGIALLVFITLATVALATVIQTLPPSPLPASAPASEFSAERAIRHIQVIATQPRPSGSSAYEAAADYVLAELEDMGLETETQRVGKVRNTIGWIRGDSSSDIVLLTAHLDSAHEGPGATDDGSGVAALLETARALMSDTPLHNTVMFLFTDAEEIGSLGAQAFINDHPMARNVRIVIGFDAGGISGPDGPSATSANNGWLIRQLAQAENSYIVGNSAVIALAVTNADFTNVFRGAGFSGYAFGLYWDPRIHAPEDSIENLNPSSIQHQGYHALSLARHFGKLDPLGDPGEPDAIFFSVLRLLVVTYPSIWAIPLAVAVTGIFCGVLAYGLKQKALTLAGIGYGAFVLLVGLIIAPLPYFLLGTWISGITSQVADRALKQPLQVCMLVLLALALTMIWYYLSRRIKNVSIPDLTMGALTPMAIAMLGTSIAFSAISFTFTWPLLFSLLSSANWFYSYAHRKNSTAAILGLLFSGATSIVIIGLPLLLGLFASAQMQIALVFLGVLFGFLVPHFHLVMGCTIENKKQLEESGSA
ncbi:MAG: M20/M25/M40 family metallo-hydrolase [Phycisphaerales bacterium]|nr:MAG: M20/M25/M40 family metallo-hydrolase [Phycisphaerales bacterium]